MKKIGLFIISILLAVVIFSQKTEASDDYLSGRAIVLANFQSDEVEQVPEIRYILPGEKGNSPSVLDPSVRIVNLIDPNLNFSGVQAIFRAPEFSINDAGHLKTIKSFKKSVGDVLNEGGFDIADQDQVQPALLEKANPSIEIKITRVSIATLEKTESIPYQTKQVDDPTLERGLTNVSQSGQNGSKKLSYEVRRENGVEVSRTLTKDETIQKPQDKIIKVGTKVVVLSSVRGYATIYNPSNCSVVSANYSKGDTVRITNQANGVQVIKTVDCTWGTATASDGNVLDLARSILTELKYDWTGKGLFVLVEKLKN